MPVLGDAVGVVLLLLLGVFTLINAFKNTKQ